MYLSIFNSERTSAGSSTLCRRAFKGVLVGCVLIMGLLELGVRSFIYQVSENLSRIHTEANAAKNLRQESVQKHILIMGNSLLLHDLDISEVNRQLNPLWKVSRFAIEQTTYYDWHFGLKKLMAQGARPDVMVLCFEVRHLIQSSVRNDMFAYYLMQTGDVLDVMTTLNLSASDTLDLLLANISASFALRKEIRQVGLQRVLPDLPSLTGMLARFPRFSVESSDIYRIGRERLLSVKKMASEHEIRVLILLVPPLPSNVRTSLETVARETAVPILIPPDSIGLGPHDYMADGYHLNERGRKTLTEALIPLLRTSL